MKREKCPKCESAKIIQDVRDCGYAELYAVDPNRLWEAYAASRHSGAT